MRARDSLWDHEKVEKLLSYFFLQFAKFSVGDRDGVFANDVDAIGLAPLAKFDSVCDTMQGEDEYAEDEVDED